MTDALFKMRVRQAWDVAESQLRDSRPSALVLGDLMDRLSTAMKDDATNDRPPPQVDSGGGTPADIERVERHMSDAHLMPLSSAERCDCVAAKSRVWDRHDHACAVYACECGARTLIGEEHTADCEERCPHCGSEGPDNDHREGCPTLDTCAQICPQIPVEEGWHRDEDWLNGAPFTSAAFSAHLRDVHGRDYHGRKLST